MVRQDQRVAKETSTGSDRLKSPHARETMPLQVGFFKIQRVVCQLWGSPGVARPELSALRVQKLWHSGRNRLRTLITVGCRRFLFVIGRHIVGLLRQTPARAEVWLPV